MQDNPLLGRNQVWKIFNPRLLFAVKNKIIRRKNAVINFHAFACFQYKRFATTCRH